MKKTEINSIKKDLDFLGYRFILKNNKVILKLRNNCKKRFKMRIKKLNSDYDNNKLTYREYMQELSSYYGHLKWGDCKKLFYVNNRIDFYSSLHYNTYNY